VSTRDPFEVADLDGSVRCSHVDASWDHVAGPSGRRHRTTYRSRVTTGFPSVPRVTRGYHRRSRLTAPRQWTHHRTSARCPGRHTQNGPGPQSGAVLV